MVLLLPYKDIIGTAAPIYGNRNNYFGSKVGLTAGADKKDTEMITHSISSGPSTEAEVLNSLIV